MELVRTSRALRNGAAFAGKCVNGNYIVWRAADQPDNTVWGNLRVAP
jgi:hypothetical protein